MQTMLQLLLYAVFFCDRFREQSVNNIPQTRQPTAGKSEVFRIAAIASSGVVSVQQVISNAKNCGKNIFPRKKIPNAVRTIKNMPTKNGFKPRYLFSKKAISKPPEDILNRFFRQLRGVAFLRKIETYLSEYLQH